MKASAYATLVDTALARYDFVQELTLDVHRPVKGVFEALAAYNPQHDLGLRAAFLLHDAPAVMVAKQAFYARSLSRLGPLQQSAMAFRTPSNTQGGELLLGFVGKFWSPVSPIAMPSLDQFCTWEKSGVTKVVWGFSVHATQAGSSALTCTVRTKSASVATRLAFGAYWHVITPVSEALRARMLKAIKAAAETGKL